MIYYPSELIILVTQFRGALLSLCRVVCEVDVSGHRQDRRAGVEL